MMMVSRLFCAPAATTVDRLSNIAAGVLSVVVVLVWLLLFLLLLLLRLVDISIAETLEFMASSTSTNMGSSNRLVGSVVGGMVVVIVVVFLCIGVGDALLVVIFTFEYHTHMQCAMCDVRV